MKIALFVGTAIALLVSLHVYLWLRIFKSPAWGSPWPQVGLLVLNLLGLSVVATMFLMRRVDLPTGLAQGLSFVAFVWMGMLFLLFVSTLGADLVRGVISLFASFDRIRAARCVACVGVGLGGLLSIFALYGGQHTSVREIRVPIARLPDSLQGFSIALLTDIHVSPITRRARVEALVAQTNALAPDIVAIAGDLVDGSVSQLASEVAPLAQLQARHGVFFSTGNHEYYSGAAPWIRHLPSLGVRVLQNEHVSLSGLPLDVAGIPDLTSPDPRPDVRAAIAGSDPSHIRVLLAHQPRQYAGAPEQGVDLVLSGHTHGGQIWPFRYLVPLQQPFVSGLHRIAERSWLYISNGAGTWGPPMRLFAPAEITHLTLIRG